MVNRSWNELKNQLWELKCPDYSGAINNSTEASLAVLMDIREELHTLNKLLHCSNAVAIPAILRSIRRNTSKPKPKVRKRQ